MNKGGPVLDVRGVSKVYRRDRIDVPALRGVTFEVAAGRSLAIMGPSGSGKTTILNVVAGLDRPTAGEVWVDGQRISDLDAEAATVFRRRHIGFVFQFFNLLPTMTARENVALPLLAERLPRREVEQRTSAMIDAVGLANRADHRPGELSGGEQQRVAIARALAMQPRLLLADEPTGNLDSVAGEEILGLLRDAVSTFRLSIVIVTHSYIAAAAMDRIVTMRDGMLVEGVDVPAATPGSPAARLRVVPPGPAGHS
jgi:putative ABC transport system ATP-binding protein